VIQLDDVSLAYAGRTGPVLALEGTSISVAKGEFAAVVGPSGCGKSTLMKLVTGLVKPTKGQVAVNGAPVTGPVKLAGMAFQNANLLPWRTVTENLMLPLEIVEPYRSNFRRNKDEYRARAETLLDTVGLKGFGDRFPWELSGGMQQRVGIARSLASDPAVLLMDEPMGALDAFTRESVQEILLKVWEQSNKMVFFITHSVEEALFLATRLVLMSPSPGRISHTYENVPFSREFLSHGDARRVKSEPEFIRMREEVLAIVHQREPAHV
jgi:ABC-type taurine transport system ATPase subunit